MIEESGSGTAFLVFRAISANPEASAIPNALLCTAVSLFSVPASVQCSPATIYCKYLNYLKTGHRRITHEKDGSIGLFRTLCFADFAHAQDIPISDVIIRATGKL